jgi:hypothetical protein
VNWVLGMILDCQCAKPAIIKERASMDRCIPDLTSPVSGVRIMSKGMDSKKADKKKPAKTAIEKRADKKAKKVNVFGH